MDKEFFEFIVIFLGITLLIIILVYILISTNEE
jgi:uncharacterized integral membrane protein